MPRDSDSLRMSSTVGAAALALAMRLLLMGRTLTITAVGALADGGFLQALGASCVGFRRPQRLLEAHHLHGDLDHEPVVLAEVEAGELADAAKPLPQRVRMDVERLRGRADVA